MNQPNIELIILDLDGTLYDIEDVIKSVFQTQISFLSLKTHKGYDEIKRLLMDNCVFPYVSNNSKSATELFAQMGFDKEEWTDYRNEHFDVSTIQAEKSVKENVINRLCKDFKVILLSSNTQSIIDKILSHLKISKDYFQEMVCSDRFPASHHFNKKEAIEYLSGKYDVPYSRMISIGDRYQTDIKPMFELGGMGILLHSPQHLGKVADDIKLRKLHTCKEYELYVV